MRIDLLVNVYFLPTFKKMQLMQLLNDEYFSNNVEQLKRFHYFYNDELTNQILCNIFGKWREKSIFIVLSCDNCQKSIQNIRKRRVFFCIESFEFSSRYWDILILEDISISIKMLNLHTIVNQINLIQILFLSVFYYWWLLRLVFYTQRRLQILNWLHTRSSAIYWKLSVNTIKAQKRIKYLSRVEL